MKTFVLISNLKLQISNQKFMKTYQQILLTTALFVVLFYDENAGLNIGILGISVALLTLFKTKERNKTRTFLALFATSVLSSVAFAWYGDFPSFLALVSSLFLLALKSRTKELKSLFVIPIFAVNFFTFICRFFKFDQWLPKRNTSRTLQKLISVVLIPAFFIIIFFAIYSSGSEHFANIFKNWEWNFNFWQFFVLSVLGFFLSFNYFNFAVEKFFYKQNHYLKNDFLNEDKIAKPTYSFLSIDAERTSGIVSLLALNVLLLIFIFTFNYEQFVEIPITPNQLSAETHERVNAVILSIIMAICVIMFYFKGNFNFDEKSKLLKISAKIWIFLNAVLVFSAIAKNSEYVVNFGLTYKRLGVYAFLILSLIGLIFTLIKIQKQKTNAFLFNQMFWYFYGTILVCSFINWGGIITYQNLQRKSFDKDYLVREVNFNEKQLLKYAKENKDDEMKTDIILKLLDIDNRHFGQTFLSKILYYETIE